MTNQNPWLTEQQGLPLPPQQSALSPIPPQAGYVPAQPVPGGEMSGALFRAQSEYEEQRKSLGLAYLFWFFLGAFGAHRFYLRRTGSAIAMLVLGLTFVGLLVTGIWALVDAFLIPGIAARLNTRLRQESYARYRVPLY